MESDVKLDYYMDEKIIKLYEVDIDTYMDFHKAYSECILTLVDKAKQYFDGHTERLFDYLECEEFNSKGVTLILPIELESVDNDGYSVYVLLCRINFDFDCYNSCLILSNLTGHLRSIFRIFTEHTNDIREENNNTFKSPFITLNY